MSEDAEFADWGGEFSARGRQQGSVVSVADIPAAHSQQSQSNGYRSPLDTGREVEGMDMDAYVTLPDHEGDHDCSSCLYDRERDEIFENLKHQQRQSSPSKQLQRHLDTSAAVPLSLPDGTTPAARGGVDVINQKDAGGMNRNTQAASGDFQRFNIWSGGSSSSLLSTVARNARGAEKGNGFFHPSAGGAAHFFDFSSPAVSASSDKKRPSVPVKNTLSSSSFGGKGKGGSDAPGVGEGQKETTEGERDGGFPPLLQKRTTTSAVTAACAGGDEEDEDEEDVDEGTGSEEEEEANEEQSGSPSSLSPSPDSPCEAPAAHPQGRRESRGERDMGSAKNLPDHQRAQKEEEEEEDEGSWVEEEEEVEEREGGSRKKKEITRPHEELRRLSEENEILRTTQAQAYTEAAEFAHFMRSEISAAKEENDRIVREQRETIESLQAEHQSLEKEVKRLTEILKKQQEQQQQQNAENDGEDRGRSEDNPLQRQSGGRDGDGDQSAFSGGGADMDAASSVGFGGAATNANSLLASGTGVSGFTLTEEEMKDRMRRLQDQNRGLRGSIAGLKGKLESLQKEKADLQSRNATLETSFQELAAAKQREANAEISKNALRGRLETAMRLCEEHKRERQVAEKAREEAEEKMGEAVGDVVRLKEAVERAERQARQAEENVEEWMGKAEAAETGHLEAAAEVAALMARLAETESELSAVESSAAQAEAEAERNAQRLERRWTSRCEQQEEELNRLKVLFQEAERVVDGERDRANILEAELRQVQTERLQREQEQESSQQASSGREKEKNAPQQPQHKASPQTPTVSGSRKSPHTQQQQKDKEKDLSVNMAMLVEQERLKQQIRQLELSNLQMRNANEVLKKQKREMEASAETEKKKREEQRDAARDAAEASLRVLLERAETRAEEAEAALALATAAVKDSEKRREETERGTGTGAAGTPAPSQRVTSRQGVEKNAQSTRGDGGGPSERRSRSPSPSRSLKHSKKTDRGDQEKPGHRHSRSPRTASPRKTRRSGASLRSPSPIRSAKAREREKHLSPPVVHAEERERGPCLSPVGVRGGATDLVAILSPSVSSASRSRSRSPVSLRRGLQGRYNATEAPSPKERRGRRGGQEGEERGRERERVRESKSLPPRLDRHRGRDGGRVKGKGDGMTRRSDARERQKVRERRSNRSPPPSPPSVSPSPSPSPLPMPIPVGAGGGGRRGRERVERPRRASRRGRKGREDGEGRLRSSSPSPSPSFRKSKGGKRPGRRQTDGDRRSESTDRTLSIASSPACLPTSRRQSDPLEGGRRKGASREEEGADSVSPASRPQIASTARSREPTAKAYSVEDSRTSASASISRSPQSPPFSRGSTPKRRPRKARRSPSPPHYLSPPLTTGGARHASGASPCGPMQLEGDHQPRPVVYFRRVFQHIPPHQRHKVPLSLFCPGGPNSVGTPRAPSPVLASCRKERASAALQRRLPAPTAAKTLAKGPRKVGGRSSVFNPPPRGGGAGARVTGAADRGRTPPESVGASGAAASGQRSEALRRRLTEALNAKASMAKELDEAERKRRTAERSADRTKRENEKMKLDAEAAFLGRVADGRPTGGTPENVVGGECAGPSTSFSSAAILWPATSVNASGDEAGDGDGLDSGTRADAHARRGKSAAASTPREVVRGGRGFSFLEEISAEGNPNSSQSATVPLAGRGKKGGHSGESFGEDGIAGSGSRGGNELSALTAKVSSLEAELNNYRAAVELLQKDREGSTDSPPFSPDAAAPSHRQPQRFEGGKGRGREEEGEDLDGGLRCGEGGGSCNQCVRLERDVRTAHEALQELARRLALQQLEAEDGGGGARAACASPPEGEEAEGEEYPKGHADTRWHEEEEEREVEALGRGQGDPTGTTPKPKRMVFPFQQHPLEVQREDGKKEKRNGRQRRMSNQTPVVDEELPTYSGNGELFRRSSSTGRGGMQSQSGGGCASEGCASCPVHVHLDDDEGRGGKREEEGVRGSGRQRTGRGVNGMSPEDCSRSRSPSSPSFTDEGSNSPSPVHRQRGGEREGGRRQSPSPPLTAGRPHGGGREDEMSASEEGGFLSDDSGGVYKRRGREEGRLVEREKEREGEQSGGEGEEEEMRDEEEEEEEDKGLQRHRQALQDMHQHIERELTGLRHRLAQQRAKHRGGGGGGDAEEFPVEFVSHRTDTENAGNGRHHQHGTEAHTSSLGGLGRDPSGVSVPAAAAAGGESIVSPSPYVNLPSPPRVPPEVSRPPLMSSQQGASISPSHWQPAASRCDPVGGDTADGTSPPKAKQKANIHSLPSLAPASTPAASSAQQPMHGGGDPRLRVWPVPTQPGDPRSAENVNMSGVTGAPPSGVRHPIDCRSRISPGVRRADSLGQTSAHPITQVQAPGSSPSPPLAHFNVRSTWTQPSGVTSDFYPPLSPSQMMTRTVVGGTPSWLPSAQAGPASAFLSASGAAAPPPPVFNAPYSISPTPNGISPSGRGFIHLDRNVRGDPPHREERGRRVSVSTDHNNAKAFPAIPPDSLPPSLSPTLQSPLHLQQDMIEHQFFTEDNTHPLHNISASAVAERGHGGSLGTSTPFLPATAAELHEEHQIHPGGPHDHDAISRPPFSLHPPARLAHTATGLSRDAMTGSQGFSLQHKERERGTASVSNQGFTDAASRDKKNNSLFVYSPLQSATTISAPLAEIRTPAALEERFGPITAPPFHTTNAAALPPLYASQEMAPAEACRGRAREAPPSRVGGSGEAKSPTVLSATGPAATCSSARTATPPRPIAVIPPPPPPPRAPILLSSGRAYR